jgi:hypothetical protein
MSTLPYMGGRFPTGQTSEERREPLCRLLGGIDTIQVHGQAQAGRGPARDGARTSPTTPQSPPRHVPAP